MGVKISEIIGKAVDIFKDENVAMLLNEKKKRKVPAIPTGLAPLDLALGVGGIPKGRIIEVFGPESSGKTTLVSQIIARAQSKENAWVWYGDMEHALDPSWLEKLGVDMDHFIISQPDNAEQCLDLAEYFIKTGVIDIVVVDSVSALVPRAELAGESGDAAVGLQARLMSQAMRKMSPLVNRQGCNAFFINQIREKIGVTWGSPETTSGGRALKFFASVRIDIRKISNENSGDKDNPDIIGSVHRVKIVKNKVAPPFKICELILNYDNGFDIVANLFYIAVEKDYIEKQGNTYSYEGKALGVGQKKAIKGLRDLGNEVIEDLYKKVIGKIVVSPKGEIPPEVKEKLAKYEKSLAEATTDEEKKKWQDKIEKINSGEVDVE